MSDFLPHGLRGVIGEKLPLGREPEWHPREGNIFEWILQRVEKIRAAMPATSDKPFNYWKKV